MRLEKNAWGVQMLEFLNSWYNMIISIADCNSVSNRQQIKQAILELVKTVEQYSYTLVYSLNHTWLQLQTKNAPTPLMIKKLLEFAHSQIRMRKESFLSSRRKNAHNNIQTD